MNNISNPSGWRIQFPNVLAAVTVGKNFKVPEKKSKTAIENYVPSNSRSQLLQKGTNKIILGCLQCKSQQHETGY